YREVSPTGNTIAHNRGKLRNPSRRNDGVIAKDSPEIVFVRENFILHWKKHPSGIDQVNNGKRAFECDSLSANHFLSRLRKERASLNRGVIGNNHARDNSHVADPCNYPSRRNLPPLVVHLVSCPQADFEKGRIFVQQMTEPLAHWQPTHLTLALVTGFTPAFTQNSFLLRNRRAVSAQYFTSAGRR